MKIADTRPDGSIDCEPDFNDGTIYVGLRNARQIAEEQDTLVHFKWNDRPIAVAADTDLDLIVRSWEARQPGDAISEIGPHPDPATTPERTHGTLVVNLSW